MTTQESAAARLGELDSQGNALALAFLLIIGTVCVLLTAVSLAVTASAERRPRGQEFASLRRQGMRASVVRGAVFASYGGLVGVAVLGRAGWPPPFWRYGYRRRCRCSATGGTRWRRRRHTPMSSRSLPCCCW